MNKNKEFADKAIANFQLVELPDPKARNKAYLLGLCEIIGLRDWNECFTDHDKHRIIFDADYDCIEEEGVDDVAETLKLINEGLAKKYPKYRFAIVAEHKYVY